MLQTTIHLLGRLQRYLKLISIISTVSFGPSSKRHFLTALSASTDKRGLPPRTLVSRTWPSGDTVAEIRTVPVIRILRASSGYSGSMLVFSLRLPALTAEAEPSCARLFGVTESTVANESATAICKIRSLRVRDILWLLDKASSFSNARPVPALIWP